MKMKPIAFALKEKVFVCWSTIFLKIYSFSSQKRKVKSEIKCYGVIPVLKKVFIIQYYLIHIYGRFQLKISIDNLKSNFGTQKATFVIIAG